MDTAQHLHFSGRRGRTGPAPRADRGARQRRRHPRHRRARRLDGAAHASGRVHAAGSTSPSSTWRCPAWTAWNCCARSGDEISGAPDRDRRPAGRRAVLGRDPGAGVRHRPARHHRQAGHQRQAENPARQLPARGRAARARGRAELRLRGSRPGPAEAPVRTLLPAQDRTGHRPGQGTGRPSRAGAIRSTACWGRPPSSTRSNRTTASTSSTGA
jgi:hypothetical protein